MAAGSGAGRREVDVADVLDWGTTMAITITITRRVAREGTDAQDSRYAAAWQRQAGWGADSSVRIAISGGQLMRTGT